MFSIYSHERKIKKVSCIALILFNLISFYFIIDLSNYDEIISYLPGGTQKFSNPREWVVVFFISVLSNLFFILVILVNYLTKTED